MRLSLGLHRSSANFSPFSSLESRRDWTRVFTRLGWFHLYAEMKWNEERRGWKIGETRWSGIVFERQSHVQWEGDEDVDFSVIKVGVLLEK